MVLQESEERGELTVRYQTYFHNVANFRCLRKIGKRKRDFEAEWQHEEEAMKKARVDLQNGNYGAVLAYTQASSDA